MDLIGIFHMVDMPSSGKCDFNHIYVVGLVQSHFDTVLFDSVHFGSLSLPGVHLVFMFWYGYCSKSGGFCCHSHTVCFSQIQGVVLYSVDMCGSCLPFDFCG